MVDSVISWCRENWWLAPVWLAVVIARAVHRSWKRERIRRWIEWWWPHLPHERKLAIILVRDAVAESKTNITYLSPFGEQNLDQCLKNIMVNERSNALPWSLDMLHYQVAEHVVAATLHRTVASNGTAGRWVPTLLPWT
jgi:RNase P protein component